MLENPPYRIVIGVILALAALAITSPAFAVEASTSSAAIEAMDVAFDSKVMEELERKLDENLAADVSRLLSGFVNYRAAGQQRWIAQHYFYYTAPPRHVPASLSILLRSDR